MHLSTILVCSLPILCAIAAPIADADTSTTVATTTTIAITSTITNTITPTDTSAASSTSTGPLTYPTSAFTVISARSGSQIHLLPLNAAGQAFYLGGSPATYCPLSNQTLCPPGDVTAFLGTSALYTEVPGGQQIFVAPDGHLGFTAPHSAYIPPGSVIPAFTYFKSQGSSFGDLGTSAFGASGFMACPPAVNATTGSPFWQVFAAIANATVPTGKVADCLGFDALTSDYTAGVAAAWEYT